jgi:hypothetical protein
MVSPYVSLGITRSDGPTSLYAQDLRALGGDKTWNLLVSTDQPNAKLTVNWPNMASVPRNYRLTLQDPVTGQTIDMRTRASYTFQMPKGSLTRSLTVTATLGHGVGRVVISGLFVDPIAGRGAGVSGYDIRYNLSRDAQVDVQVLGSNGRVLNAIATTRAVTAGNNHVVWNGRDAAGHVLPGGVYTLQVRAITPEGDVSRQIYPIVLTGR